MKNIFSISFITFFILISACRPEPLRIDVPPAKEQVVVFSQIIPGEFMTLALTRTIGALDFNEEEGDSLTQSFLDKLLVKGADVSVSYGGIRDHLYPIADGLYASVTTPQIPNQLYTLRVMTPEGDSLIAESMMLPQITFDEVQPVIKRGEDTLVTIQYKFTDLPEDNWYMINVYTNGAANNDGVDINSFFDSGTNVLKKTELFNDVAFDDSIVEGTIELPNVNPVSYTHLTLPTTPYV